MTLTFV